MLCVLSSCRMQGTPCCVSVANNGNFLCLVLYVGDMDISYLSEIEHSI